METIPERPISTPPLIPGSRFKDIRGEKYGRLTALEPIGRKDRFWVWRCRCECGAECVVAGQSLRCGKTRSCGCLVKEGRGRLITEHRGEYNVWYELKRWHRSEMCRRWLEGFARFLEDMGLKPVGCGLIRVDERKQFGPANCRWGETGRGPYGRRLTFRGQTRNISEWAKVLGLTPERVRQRVNAWPLEEALSPGLPRKTDRALPPLPPRGLHQRAKQLAANFPQGRLLSHHARWQRRRIMASLVQGGLSLQVVSACFAVTVVTVRQAVREAQSAG
jgi:hypothetical protein